MPGLDALTAGVGQTDQRDARHAVGGLLAVQGPTALDIRTGVLTGPGSTALITGTTKTGPKMSVQIGVHVAVPSRGAANGAYLGPTLEAPLEVDVDLAPASGSRIDVVYVKQRDTTSGIPTPDVTPGPLYGVLTGQVSTGTPGKPDLSTIVGAEELGTVQVSASATSTNGSGVVITNTARQTVARGGVLPVADPDGRAALAAAGGVYRGLVVHERSTGRLYEWSQPTGQQAGAWRYVGGEPPPTTLIPVSTGWSADAAHRPQCYIDASGLVHVEGWWRNIGDFTLNGTQYPITLPAGFRPKQTKVWLIPTAAGDGYVTATVFVDGRVRLDARPVGAALIGANTIFFLDNIAPFHPATTGTAALS